MFLRFLTPALLLGATFVASGCSQLHLGSHFAKSISDAPAPYQAPPITGPRKIGNPYKIMGKWYYPRSSSEGYREKGIASWYGRDFHGKPTANGEKYNMYDITAAHPTLPIPTYVRVTNLDNGKSLIVRVNDRGPFLRGRVIDLSYRSAQLLGFQEKGVTPVLLEALPTDGSPLRRNQQVEQIEVAERQPQKDSFTHRVSDAAKQAGEIAQTDNSNLVAHPEVTTDKLDKVEIFVQTGSFSEQPNAQRQQASLAKIYDKAHIQKANVKGQTFYRVRIGPLDNVDAADRALADVIKNSYNNAIIVVD